MQKIKARWEDKKTICTAKVRLSSTFCRTGKAKPKTGLPSHDGAVSVARSLGRSRRGATGSVWGKRLIPPYKITIIFLNSFSFAEAVNKQSLFGLMERWENQIGVGEVRDLHMRGSETSHSGLGWVWRWLENNPKEFFMRWEVLFSDYGAFREPHEAWIESSFLTDGWL